MKLLKRILPLCLAVMTALCLMLAVTACGEDEPTPTPDIHNHTYGEWQTTTAPTCTETGVKTKTCTCGEKLTESIPATGHIDADGNDTCDVCLADLSEGNDPAEDKNIYTVTLVDTSDAPIKGATLQLFNGTTAVTDAEGKAEFDVPKDAFMAYFTIVSLPEGYEKTANFDAIFFTEEKTLTVKNGEKKSVVVYELMIVDESGNAVSGVMAQICPVGQACVPGTSDENGRITVEISEAFAAAGVQAKIIDAAYTSKIAGEGYIDYVTGTTTLTVVVVLKTAA